MYVDLCLFSVCILAASREIPLLYIRQETHINKLCGAFVSSTLIENFLFFPETKLQVSSVVVQSGIRLT